ncbi:SUKH-4 family immunity protein [Nonomuraea africana]|uniref:SUKH-4 family immunity protein n=1 Tax=Nonomuraea africana TaxID=46171 RepID=UPI0033FEE392
MELPRDLPRALSQAFHAVGLPWPDARLDHFDGVLAELGDRPEARRLRDHVRVLRKAQRVFFEHLRDLTDEHDGSGMRLIGHKDRPCVSEVREKWARTAAQMADYHEAVRTLTRQAIGGLRASSELPAVPDYLAGSRPAWLERRPERGIRDEPTAGRALAAEALLRWREDPYGPRICVVTGSPASGKTRLLAWFSHSTGWHWSGYPGPSEAAVWLRGMDVEAAVRELARQLRLDGDEPAAPDGPAHGDADPERALTGLARPLAALDRPVLVTLADPHRSADPGRTLTELIRPLVADPRVRLLVEFPDPTALRPYLTSSAELSGVPVFVLDLDDPRCTDRDAFTAWYAAERAGHSPFTADQVYPSPALAAIAARARGADPGPALPIAERVAGAWLDGLSPAARAAVGTLALALAPIGLYTWRLLHCGRHRDDPEAAARGVAEAAAHLPLAEPGLPAYAVDLPALAEAAAPPPEAHGELAAVMRGWPVSAELGPPEYARMHLAGHERMAGGPAGIAPLPLCRPPVRVTRELLESLYGAGGVIRLAADEIHPAITHEPTRRFLAEVGLPRNGVHEEGWTGDRLRCVKPMTEWWPEEDVRELRACAGLPGDLGAVFMLDYVHVGHLFLDGRTGLVYELCEGQGTARIANRDVESYAYFAYVIHRERALWCGKEAHLDAAYWCAEDLALELHTYEPQAMAGDESLWPLTLLDYTLLT